MLQMVEDRSEVDGSAGEPLCGTASHEVLACKLRTGVNAVCARRERGSAGRSAGGRLDRSTRRPDLARAATRSRTKRNLPDLRRSVCAPSPFLPSGRRPSSGRSCRLGSWPASERLNRTSSHPGWMPLVSSRSSPLAPWTSLCPSRPRTVSHSSRWAFCPARGSPPVVSLLPLVDSLFPR
jgi:hypothetical protein